MEPTSSPNSLQKIPLAQTNFHLREDRLVWKNGAFGKFSVKEAYAEIISNLDNYHSSLSTKFWKKSLEVENSRHVKNFHLESFNQYHPNQASFEKLLCLKF